MLNVCQIVGKELATGGEELDKSCRDWSDWPLHTYKLKFAHQNMFKRPTTQDAFDHDKGQKVAISGKLLH